MYSYAYIPCAASLMSFLSHKNDAVNLAKLTTLFIDYGKNKTGYSTQADFFADIPIDPSLSPLSKGGIKGGEAKASALTG